MKHKLLSLLVLTAGMSMVACSDDKGSGGQVMCGTQACSMQRAALAQVPGSPENAAMLKAGITPPGVPGPNNGPLTQIPGGAGQVDPRTGLKLTSTAAIHAQSAKVAAALEADKHNPDSPYYVPDETTAAPESGRSPASVALQSNTVADVPPVPPVAQGGGEATH